MTPSELKQSRKSLGLSAQGFANAFGIASGRTVRKWEAGAPVPRSVELLVVLALEFSVVRIRLGIPE